MTKEEIIEIKSLCVDFAQSIIDHKLTVDLEKLRKQRTFNDVFVQLYSLAMVKVDPRCVKFFAFLGSKINSPNQNEYTTIFRDSVLEHLKANGYK
jgi:hypothetical protein